MTFHTFNPSTDTLEVGAEIRLAGREGKILSSSVNMAANNVWYKISWNDDIDATQLFLLNYPLLEIADKPAKSLTIDMRVKERLLKILTDTMWGMEIKPANLEEARAFLNSLEET